jgi:hypothetical protein
LEKGELYASEFMEVLSCTTSTLKISLIKSSEGSWVIIYYHVVGNPLADLRLSEQNSSNTINFYTAPALFIVFKNTNGT